MDGYAGYVVADQFDLPGVQASTYIDTDGLRRIGRVGGDDDCEVAEARIGRYGRWCLTLHGEESPCARYALEFVFTAFDEVDA